MGAETNTVQVGNFKFTPELLTKNFQTYRKELIVQPMLAMDALLKHCSVRTGIRYRETVTEMSGKFEIGNYKKDTRRPRHDPPGRRLLSRERCRPLRALDEDGTLL